MFLPCFRSSSSRTIPSPSGRRKSASTMSSSCILANIFRALLQVEVLTLWRPLLSSRRHTKSEYMGLSSMTIILPIVPPPSLPNQQSAVLVPIQPLQRIVYLYPQCLPYGWLHTVSPMAARFLSASTSFSDGVLIRPVLSCPWPSAALRTSFTSACVVLVSFFNVCCLLPKASRAIG